MTFYLVSQSTVSTINQAAAEANAANVCLKTLRPATWLTLREHLLYNCEASHDQLIHFDMLGEILELRYPQAKVRANLLRSMLNSCLKAYY